MCFGDSQVSLPGGVALSLPGDRAQGRQLQIALCCTLFCSLKAFSTDGVQGSGYGRAPISSPPPTTLQGALTEMQSITLVSLVSDHPLCDRLVTKLFFFYLSHPTWFRVSKLYRLLWCGPKPILPGEREVVSLCFCILLAPGQRGVMRTCSNSQFMATRSKKLAPRLAVFSWLPISDAWKLCHIWHTHTPLLLVTLGILGPHYPMWDSIPLRPMSILKPGTSPTVADF